jgi:hypothetical protein
MKIDFSQLTPATKGAHRSCPASYLGGRMHGMNGPAGWHSMRRDEVGRDLDDETARKIPHYILYVADDGLLWHYIHSSLLPDPECA